MTPDRRSGSGDPATGEDLRAALRAERAAADHWRTIAQRRERDLLAIRRRTSVRAVLSLDRRTGPLRARLRGVVRRTTGEIDRTRLALSAPRRGTVARRRAALDDAVATLEAIPPDPRSISIVVVTGEEFDCSGTVTAASSPSGSRDVVVVRTTDAVVDIAGARTIEARGQDAVAAARLGAASSTGELICFLAATTEAMEPGWLDRLAAPLRGTVAVTVPTLFHPRRPWSRATPDDLLVRARGITISLDEEGVPRPRAHDAGVGPDPDGGAAPVVAGSAACLLVEREAYEAVGGLEPLASLDASCVDLCLRLRELGRTTAAVSSSMLVDHAGVPSPRALTEAVTDRGWRDVIARHGPSLVRTPGGDERGGLRFVFTVGAPSTKVAPRWGDWHLAGAFGRALDRRGHTALVRIAAEADEPATRIADVHVVVRGLARVDRSQGQRHVLWVISHPEDVDDAELDDADLVLVASARFAKDLERRTSTPVEVLLQATEPRRFFPHTPDPRCTHPVLVVAKTRDVPRPIVTDALAAGLRPAIHGSGWDEFVDPELVVTEHVPYDELPVLYSSAGVLLNDHWGTMRTCGFVSNRIFDALACATPVISDHLPEIRELFGDTVPTYHTPGELGRLVRADLDDPAGARERAQCGREVVLAAHTFDHRAGDLLDALARHGLIDSAALA